MHLFSGSYTNLACLICAGAPSRNISENAEQVLQLLVRVYAFGYLQGRFFSDLATQLVHRNSQLCTFKWSSLRKHLLLQPGMDLAQQMIWLTYFKAPIKV